MDSQQGGVLQLGCWARG